MKSFKTTYYGKNLWTFFGEMHFGEGTALEAGKLLKDWDVKKVMVLYDEGLKKIGLANPMVEEIKKEGIEVVIFDRVIDDPPDFNIEEAAKIANDENVDAVIGFGGGSVIDATKIMSVYKENEGPLRDYLHRERRFKNPAKVKIIYVPTTSGTGAEITVGGIVTDSSNNNYKCICIGALADVVLMDPTLTMGVDPYLTYVTAIDAYSHAFERYTSKPATPRSGIFCGQTIENVWRSMPKAMANPRDLEARGELMLAANFTMDATQGGAAAMGHGIAHALGGRFHLLHGHLLALLLPPEIRYVANTHEVDDTLQAIAKRMNLEVPDGNYGEAIAQAIEAYNREMKIKNLKDLGVQYDELLATIPTILGDTRTMAVTPGKIDADAMKVILDYMYSC